MSKLIAKCSLGFKRDEVERLDIFAVGVLDNIYKHSAVFPSPPITQVELQTNINNLINKRAAYKQGGMAQKGPYMSARKTLLNNLSALASYTNSVAQGNVNKILMSGFEPTKVVRTASNVPATPIGIKVENGVRGEIIVECKTIANATNYGCIMVHGQPLPDNIKMNEVGQLVMAQRIQQDEQAAQSQKPNMVFDLTKSKKKRFVNLQAGVMYYFYFFAVNAAGTSRLSDAVRGVFV